MTTPIAEPNTVKAASPPLTENPQVDERLWQAWIEKNKKRDKIRFARVVKVVAILVVLVALAASIHQMAG
jgi:hypothetical protein